MTGCLQVLTFTSEALYRNFDQLPTSHDSQGASGVTSLELRDDRCGEPGMVFF